VEYQPGEAVKYRSVRIAEPLLERLEQLSEYIRGKYERDGIPAASLNRQVGIALAIGLAELERQAKSQAKRLANRGPEIVSVAECRR